MFCVEPPACACPKVLACLFTARVRIGVCVYQDNACWSFSSASLVSWTAVRAHINRSGPLLLLLLLLLHLLRDEQGPPAKAPTLEHVLSGMKSEFTTVGRAGRASASESLSRETCSNLFSLLNLSRGTTVRPEHQHHSSTVSQILFPDFLAVLGSCRPKMSVLSAVRRYESHFFLGWWGRKTCGCRRVVHACLSTKGTR